MAHPGGGRKRAGGPGSIKSVILTTKGSDFHCERTKSERARWNEREREREHGGAGILLALGLEI